ncbi:MAG: ABC transporter permease [Erysipelotrichaceae bacterium]|nr:ABC transporter permease [Erysipelotrichaceae bacterium]
MLDYILTYDFFFAIIRMSTPLIFVAMAAIIGAKANVLCIAYESVMLFSALGGVIGSALTQNLFVGMFTGIFCGLIISSIFAYFVLYLNTKPLLAGLALNTLGTGGTVYIIYLITGMKLDTSSLNSLRFPNVELFIIKDIPFIGKLLSGHNILSYLAFLSVLFAWFLIYKTTLGLRIRAVGENPDSAMAVGINVNKTKFIAILISGVIAAFGGLFMSMAYLPYFTVNMTAGRGFIGIAAQNLGLGNPIWTTVYTIIFGISMALGNTAQSFRLPSQFASMMPYLITLIGLLVIGMSNKYKEKRIKKEN